MECCQIFVYGTLLNTDNEFARFLSLNSTFVTLGKVKGKLYNIGEYPGAIPDANATSFIYGAIYRIHNISVLCKLDEYEGISEKYALPHEYVRQEIEIDTSNGPTLCWMYVYNWPVKNLELIKTGKYFN